MDGQTAADLDVARTRLPRLVAWYFTRGHSCALVRGRPPAAVLPLGLQPCNAGLQPLQLLSALHFCRLSQQRGRKWNVCARLKYGVCC